MNDETKQATGTAVDRAGPPYRSTPRSISPSTPRSTLVASCVCALLAGGPAAALELGEPVVRSGLGQPLEVVVPYATWGNERLTADCVSLVRGDPTGLPALTAGRVSSTAGNRLVIRSDRGIREPLLGMNLKVDCASTPFIIRSYTLIIDPPGLAPVGAEPAPVPAPRRAPADPAAVLPATPAGGRDSRATAPAPAEPLSPGSEYRVRVGDTLSTIAQRVTDRPGGIWATAERIFAANPEAFIDGDMNLLRAGSVLEIPATDARTAGAEPAAAAAATTAAAAMAPMPAAPPVDPSAAAGEPGLSAPTAGAGASAAAAAPAATTPAVSVPSTTSASSASSASSADRIRPAVRQAMNEMAAEPPSPFKSEAADDASIGDDGLVQTPAGPAPRIADADPATRSSVSPLFAALFGAGIGLLLGLVIFRSSLREFFRRAPTPAAARRGVPAAGAAAVADRSNGAAADGGDTDVIATPVFEREEPDVIVSEEEWSDAAHSKLKSLDLDFGDEEDGFAGGEAMDDLSDDVITEQQLAVARMNFPDFDDSETVEETDGAAVLPPDERIDESMIMEVDTGAELAADADAGQNGSGKAEDTGTLATVADLEMLEEDYEQEFTATQRLAKQLADAAIALDQEISSHGDEIDESIAETIAETIASTRAAEARAAAADGTEETGATAVLDRDGDIIDESDQTAVLSADDATTEMPLEPEDEGDTVEHTGVYAAATAELPSAEQSDARTAYGEGADEDDQSDRETAVIPLSEKRRA
ncbi:type IV pilus assembly protein FimV [Lentisalinibacter orientalis]|uniref:type IV pilus assembly protein FimV n=1 Tax=Lentisalinibacter orientalis TaxID=2992241 RepID=UPI00386B2FBD